MIKNAFYFILKALFGLKIFKCLSLLFGDEEKHFDKKDKFNFKIYDVKTWETNNCNTHIAQYLKNKGNQKMKFGQLIKYNMGNIFLENHTQNVVEELFPDPIKY